MPNLDSVLKRRYITLSIKVCPYFQSYDFFQQSYMDIRIRQQRRLNTDELLLLNCGAGEDF